MFSKKLSQHSLYVHVSTYEFPTKKKHNNHAMKQWHPDDISKNYYNIHILFKIKNWQLCQVLVAV